MKMNDIFKGKIFVGGKCSDMAWYYINNENGETVKDGEGYAPYIKGVSDGDYIEIEVDNETGKVIGWVPMTNKVVESFGEEDCD